MRVIFAVVLFLFSLSIISQDSILQELESRKAPTRSMRRTNHGGKIVLKITNQAEFDELQDKLSNLISKSCKRIEVKLGEGTFLFHENQILLQDIDASDLSISIIGNHSKVIADGYVEGADMGMPTETSLDTVDILDVDKKLCRIHLQHVPEVPVKKMQLTEWFLTRFYDIDEIREGWAYFTAPELFYSDDFPHSWNVNWDWGYCKELPRYRLYTELDKCQNGSFLKVRNCKLNHLSISGIKFVGNGGTSDLLDLQMLTTQGVTVENCHFYGLHSRVMYLYKTPNVLFRRNLVEKTYGSCFFSGAGSTGTMVVENIFRDTSLGLNNTVDVTLYSPDFYVAHNKFHNVQYSGISIGYNWAAVQEDKVTGIVEYNELWQDSVYLSHYRQFSMMDGGPIYVSTRLDDVIVRYNHIHDIIGIRDNRGIFLDDGAKNMKIYGNVIHRVHNYYCIDSRLVEHVSSKVEDYNTGNYMAYNLIAGCYKFQGRTDSLENNIKGVNYIAVPSIGELPKNELQNLSNTSADSYVQERNGQGMYLYLDKRNKSELKSCPVWKGMKRWVRFEK